MLRRVTPIITCLPLSFVSDTLDEVLVKITNIQMPHLRTRSGEKPIKPGTAEQHSTAVTSTAALQVTGMTACLMSVRNF